jgi:ATP-dependent exoDNAse (exonuclease V) beta subunit
MAANEILQADTEISFPQFILLKASAGTGKTHALTLRFTQFLLSPRIKNNDLKQILAITFTRNAAKEMKSRIIQWLKDCYFGQEKTLAELQPLVRLDKETLASRAEKTLENLLSRYSDFQVMTIDSFLAEVFRAAAIDLGLSPDFEISLNPLPLIDYAFYRFLRKVTPDSAEGERLMAIASSLQEMSQSEAAFKWDPTEDIKKKFLELYSRLEAMNRRPCLNFPSEELDLARQKLQQAAEKIERIVQESGLAFRKDSSFPGLLEKIKSGFLADLLDKSLKAMPINKPGKGNLAQNRGYELAQQAWQEFQEALNSFKLAYSRLYFRPYLETYDDLILLLDEAKRERNIILLDDISCRLASYLHQGIVPDVYFRLGDRIYHYLIDEFQDTSPLQWFNLKPLIENSLAQGGSLFLVGDTKQAIYGFREADYEIMMNLEKKIEGFLPVQVQVRELTVNRRSRKKILDFVEKIFPAGMRKLEEYQGPASQSGLDDFNMEVSEEKLKEAHPGHVEIEFFSPDNETLEESEDSEARDSARENETGSTDQLTQVKNKVQSLVAELKSRGYNYSDIAILAYKNESVTKIAAWLNEKKIPFIPFSALDIRKRKIVQEILALLRFLDFPPDDLSLATFLLGDLLEKELSLAGLPLERSQLQDFLLVCSQKKDYPLYTAFREHYGEIWRRYFETLFKTVGYSPLYDLTTQVYRLFHVFDHFPEEEASLVRLLEVIKEFEGRGRNNLREFLLFSREEAGEENLWTIDVAAEIEAVRIMTIHKAKGLGFPVVILVLFPEINPYPTFYLEENKNSDFPAEFYILKLNKGIIKNQPELESIYSRYDIKEKVNRLNTLYVALTRARDELYIIGVQGKRSYYPLSLFEKLELVTDSEYQPGRLKPEPIKERRERQEKTISPLRLVTPIALPSEQKTIFRRAEMKRGEIIHALLASIDYLEAGWEEKLEAASTRLKSQGEEAELVDRGKEAVLAFLKNPRFSEYFRPAEGRQVILEMPLVNKKGELFRADRVIIDQNLITVIDFKTGEAEKDDFRPLYRQQIKNYLEILREIYPRKEIRGVIIYLDEKSGERVV